MENTLYLIKDVSVEWSGRNDDPIDVEDILFTTTNKEEFLKLKEKFTKVLEDVVIKELSDDKVLVLENCEHSNNCEDDFMGREIRFEEIELSVWLDYHKSANGFLMDLLEDKELISLNPETQAKADHNFALYKIQNANYWDKSKPSLTDEEKKEYELFNDWKHANKHNPDIFNPSHYFEFLKD